MSYAEDFIDDHTGEYTSYYCDDDSLINHRYKVEDDVDDMFDTIVEEKVDNNKVTSNKLKYPTPFD